MSLVPFQIAVPDDVIEDLHTRLARTRFASRTPGEPWAAGTDPGYLRELCTYWIGGFDWRAQELQINGWPQFLAEVDGSQVHFVHVRSRHAPQSHGLLLGHGWPSTFTEMLPLVPLLTDPQDHGGVPADAFDVVIPSLPGIAFSQVPTARHLTRPVVADTWARLMTDVLGYERYGVYGGDIGGDVVHWLSARHPDKVSGLHTIHPKLPADVVENPALNPVERAYMDERNREYELDGAYSHLQETRPDTVAAALLDSPAGLAAWIVEKFRAWGDCHGDIESRFDKDTLLTIITLYWVTGTIGSSFRAYYDYRHNPPRPRFTVPLGVTLSAEDNGYPRSLADRAYTDIRFWNAPGRGGHFFPLEEPDLLAEDLRSFFRPLRP